MVLTADKGVALVVMDKSQYVDKCMALLDGTKVYKTCRDTTKKLQRDVQEAFWQLNRNHGTSRLSWWSKHYYNKLLPTGNSSPVPRFYGLPKIHKANCPMWPIVSACGTATYQLAKFLTKICQRYTGITPTFVKNSKYFSEYLRSVYIGKNEELVSINVSVLFTSIPVPTALDVINHLFTDHIKVPEARGKYSWNWSWRTVSSSSRTIYMEYFEELALGSELPIPIKEWERYVDDVFSIIPKGKRDTMLPYLNSIDPHIKFTVEQPNEEGAIPFLDRLHSPNL